MSEKYWEVTKLLNSNHISVSEELITVYVKFLMSARREDLAKLFKAIKFDWEYLNGEIL